MAGTPEAGIVWANTVSYKQFEYLENEIVETEYIGEGVDGVWFTADDVKLERYLYTNTY